MALAVLKAPPIRNEVVFWSCCVAETEAFMFHTPACKINGFFGI